MVNWDDQAEGVCEKDPYEIHKKLAGRPLSRPKLKNWLMAERKISRTSAYREIEKHWNDGCIRNLSDTDKRLVNFGQSEIEDEIRRELLELCNHYSLPGFFREAEYHVGEVAVKIGQPPAKIEPYYYRLMKDLANEWQRTGQLPKAAGD
jgi:hypothetical protein